MIATMWAVLCGEAAACAVPRDSCGIAGAFDEPFCGRSGGEIAKPRRVGVSDGDADIPPLRAVPRLPSGEGMCNLVEKRPNYRIHCDDGVRDVEPAQRDHFCPIVAASTPCLRPIQFKIPSTPI